MPRKRPCRVCRKWFTPHVRAGDRQRTCGADGCQRERHRRACAAWRARHPEYDREDRLRRRLVQDEAPVAEPTADPLRRIDWPAVRALVGLGVAVTVEETGRVLHHWARDAVSVGSRAGRGESP